jgi:hypothetical protein
LFVVLLEEKVSFFFFFLKFSISINY